MAAAKPPLEAEHLGGEGRRERVARNHRVAGCERAPASFVARPENGKGPMIDLLLVQLVNGVVSGLILALVASGLTLIFGIMDVVNFAHGELFMLGAYVGTTIVLTTG